MENYTRDAGVIEMFSAKFLDLLIENNLIISDDLIDYLFDFEEQKQKFEEQIIKALNSKNITPDTIRLLTEVYEKEARKYKEEKNNTVANIGYSHLSEAEQQKKAQEIANIPVTDITNVDNKNHQLDLFILHFPVFSLKLKKEAETFTFQNSKGLEIILRSNDLGRATIQDSDLWLYCISKMMQLIFDEKIISRRIQFTGYDFLKKTGKSTSGSNYEQILQSLQRLVGTGLEANTKIGEININAGDGLIDSFKYIEDEKSKRIGIEVVLPEWLFDEVKTKKVAKINPAYFKLKPFEKRIYHLAKCSCYFDRKTQNWIKRAYNLDYFAKKVGSLLKLSDFRCQIKKQVSTQPLPEYIILYDRDKDQVSFAFKDDNVIDHSEMARKLEAKELREKTDTTKSTKNSKNIIDELQKIKDFIEEIKDKKYPIFQTQILSDEKIKEYLNKFSSQHIIQNIISTLDIDYPKKKNPEGYFYKILEKN